ncbi:Clavaminate synthase-like protein [Xylaria nigripes]|nr:Clavaminate synthase-like protein [Xylaria nigripes]
MAASSIFGRSLRLLPRNISKAPKHVWLRSQSRCFARPYTTENIQPVAPADEQASVPMGELGFSFKKYHISNHWKIDFANDTSPLQYSLKPTAIPAVTSRPWLRDACNCDRCVDPFSGQKRFATHEIPQKLPVRYICETPEGNLQVYWKDDFLTRDVHVSEYSANIWTKHPDFRRPPFVEEELWDAKQLQELNPVFSHEAFMTDGPEYVNIVSTLARVGLIRVRDVPSSEDAVLKMAERIGVLQNTFYGPSLDVKYKPEAENIAYGSSALGLHQDLVYIRNVPRIQLMHCLANSVEGGNSLFSDGHHVATQLKAAFPTLAKTLSNRKVIFRYHKGDHGYQTSRSILSKTSIFWSPLFQSPIQSEPMTKESMRMYSAWVEGAQKLISFLQDPENIFEHRLEPGECFIFDNRRVLHGRHSFSPETGERWLKKAYVEDDSYDSKLRALGITPHNLLQARSSE